MRDPIERIAAAVERMAPPRVGRARLLPRLMLLFGTRRTHASPPVTRVNRVEMSLLKGIDRMRDTLVENTERFARGLPANNALLWGARGMGKSSLVKAAHAAVNASLARKNPRSALKLIEIHREEIESLPELMTLLRGAALPVHRVLRRSVVRGRRHVLQIAQGRARRRASKAAPTMSSSTPPRTAAISWRAT